MTQAITEWPVEIGNPLLCDCCQRSLPSLVQVFPDGKYFALCSGCVDASPAPGAVTFPLVGAD